MWGDCIRPLLVNAFTSVRFSECILNDFLKFYVFFVLGAYCLEYVLNKIESISKTMLLIVTGAIQALGNIVSFNNTEISNVIYSFLLL